MRYVTAFQRICVFIFAIGLGVTGVSAQTPANEWVWLGGTNAAASPKANGPATEGQASFYGNPLAYPGGRNGAASWKDSQGNLWLFGGNGYDLRDTLGLLNDLWELDPSTQAWTAVLGGNFVTCSSCTNPGSDNGETGQPGSYGNKGTPSSTNNPGGRYLAQYWTDSSGNFWLFGGLGFDVNDQFGALDDLWEFNPTTKEWTWVAGNDQANPATVQGAKGVAEPSNTPGGRAEAFTWTDAHGNIWLFGGVGVSGAEDDLWQLNISNNEWVYEGAGSGAGSYGGGYGPPGVPVFPGSRTVGTAWTDSSGNLWLFGGEGLDFENNYGGLNDIWELNPNTVQWNWIGGSPLANQQGTMGMQGVFSAQNIPAGRGSQTNWIDKNGNIWLLGGNSNYTTESNGVVSYQPNDFWEWNTSLQQWAWMGGSSAFPGYFDQNISYGVQGPSLSSNYPAGRVYGTGWTDAYGVMWLLGGSAYQSNGSQGGSSGYTNGTDWYLNDTWAYGIPTPAPDFKLPPGTYSGTQSLTITDSNSDAQIYYTTNGTPTTLYCECFVPPTLYSSPIQLNDTTTVDAIAVAPGFINSALTSTTYDIPLTLMLSVVPNVSLTNTGTSLPVTIYLNGPLDGAPTQSTYGTITLSGGGYTSGPIQVTNLFEIFFTIPAGALAVGQDMLTATFTPNTITSAYYVTSTGSASVKVVQPIATTTRVAATANPQEVGQVVDFVVTVVGSGVGALPSQNITLTIDGVSYPTMLDYTGRNEFNIASFSPGVHTISAAFPSQGAYAPSSNTLQEIISTAPASIAVFSGSGQSTPYGLEFTQPLAAVVKDAHGYLVPGATVTFSGTGVRFSSTAAVTNESGQAIVRAYPTAAGTSTVTATVGGVSGAASFSLNATKPMLLVKANSATYAFDQPVPAPTYSFTGFVNGDTAATAVSGAASISTPAKEGSPAGTYPIGIIQGTLSAPNYTLEFEQGTISITP